MTTEDANDDVETTAEQPTQEPPEPTTTSTPPVAERAPRRRLDRYTAAVVLGALLALAAAFTAGIAVGAHGEDDRWDGRREHRAMMLKQMEHRWGQRGGGRSFDGRDGPRGFGRDERHALPGEEAPDGSPADSAPDREELPAAPGGPSSNPSPGA